MGKNENTRRFNAQMEKRLCFARCVQKQRELLIFDKMVNALAFLLARRPREWMDFPLLRRRSEPGNSLESKCVAIGRVSIGFQSRCFAPAGLVN